MPHDELGNVKNIVGSSSPGDIDMSEGYGYDRRNRLKKWTKGDNYPGTGGNFGDAPLQSILDEAIC